MAGALTLILAGKGWVFSYLHLAKVKRRSLYRSSSTFGHVVSRQSVGKSPFQCNRKPHSEIKCKPSKLEKSVFIKRQYFGCSQKDFIETWTRRFRWSILEFLTAEILYHQLFIPIFSQQIKALVRLTHTCPDVTTNVPRMHIKPCTNRIFQMYFVKIHCKPRSSCSNSHVLKFTAVGKSKKVNE